jgi:anti-sigma B factor antagonist
MSIWQQHLAGNILLVGVNGRLDQRLTPSLEQILLSQIEAGHARLLIDLSQVSYINSGGLRCLVTAWRQARAKGGDISLFGLNNRLTEVFSVAGFDQVFQIFPDRQQAQKSLQSSS